MPNPVSSLLSRVRAGFYEAGYFLTKIDKVKGVSPGIPFKTITELYLGDLAVRASIDFLADQISGQGFYTTMNEKYKEKDEYPYK